MVVLLPWIVIVVVILVLRLMQWRVPEKKISSHPVAGTVFDLLFNFHRLHDFIAWHARKHGTFRLWSPLVSFVITADPANLEYILKDNFPNYGKGDFNYSQMSDMLGDGIFAVDDNKWRHQRKVTSTEFFKGSFREYSIHVFRGNAARLASLVREEARSHTPIEVQAFFMKWTMDSMFKLAFGLNLDSLPGSVEFCDALDYTSEVIMWRYVDVSWKIKRFLNIGCEAKLKQCVKVMDDFIYGVIRRKLQHNDYEDPDPAAKREDFLSRLLGEREVDPDTITDKYIRDITLNITFAGKDTTATTLSWFFYVLCMYPRIQENIYQEVLAVTGEFTYDPDSIHEFAGKLSQEVIDKMHYLHAALTETLRLYPAIAVDPKICFSDDTFPDGFKVRKGDLVNYAPYAMGRMKCIWGDDAEVCNPERWLNKEGRFTPENPFKFPAFQGGPRICLGKELSYRQMKIFTAVLLRFFQFNLHDEQRIVKYRTMMNLQINGGFTVQASERGKASLHG